ncbi:MAG: CAP domain-containing protein [Desulfuromonas thiophila]|nr:CAP domain-containing protein [Desulfuromonas thiophila]
MTQVVITVSSKKRPQQHPDSPCAGGLASRGLNLLLLLVLLFVVAVPTRPVQAATQVLTPINEDGRQLVLAQQKYRFWQQLNEARRNPRAVLDRLDVPEELAREVLGADAWILDQGLPPLAWNDTLCLSAAGHGRDLIDQAYYSYTSRDGRTVPQRALAAGYDAWDASETLSLLLFDTQFNYDRAVALLLDNLLRDELMGIEGVPRNVFSPALTDVGLSFFAETVPLLSGSPYACLLVADFAAPRDFQPQVVGVLPAGGRLAMQRLRTAIWDFLPLLPGNAVQVRLPEGGARFVVLDAAGQTLAQQRIEDDGRMSHFALDRPGQ